MKGMQKTGDVLMMDGRTYVSMDLYKNLQKELKQRNKMLDIFIEEREYLKSVIENKKQMRII